LINRLDGRISSVSLKGNARIAFSNEMVEVQHLLIEALDAYFESKGRLGQHLDFRFRADVKDFSKWIPNASGSFRAAGKIYGSLGAPYIELLASGEKVGFEKGLVRSLNAEIRADLRGNGNIDAWLEAEKADYNGITAGHLHAAIKGSKEKHQIELNGDIEKRPIDLIISGEYEPGQWKGVLSRLETDSGKFGRWFLNVPARLALSSKGFELGKMCLDSSIESSLCASGIYDMARRKWRMNAEAEDVPMDMFSPLLAGDVLLSGKSSLNLKAEGMGTTISNGTAALNGVNAAVIPLNIHIKKGKARIVVKENRGVFTVSALSGKGAIKAAGSFNPSTVLARKGKIEVRVQGTKFLATNLPEIFLIADPDMKVSWQKGEVLVKGKVLIPEAEIDLEGIVSPETLSKDVIVIDSSRQTTKSDEIPVSANLQLELGNNVKISGYGIQGMLSGAINIVLEPGRVTMATGELNLNKGTFRMYGQKLIIKQGRLIFASTPIENPGIDIVAIREVKRYGVVVGIKATGTVQKPEITLFSNPQMDQPSILSYLVIGRPLAMASKKDGGTLIEAAQMLALKQGASIIQALSQRFGFLDVHLEEGKGERNLAMVVGLYLTPRLYISYGRSLFKSASTFKLRYELGRGWRIETVVEGENSGADLLYSPSE